MRHGLLAIAMVVAPHVALAQLSSPGPLTSSHAALDFAAHCDDCHVNGTSQLDSAKCLACHDHQALATRIQQRRGFHASANVVGKACEVCHGEHRGRGFDLMGWKAIGGKARFDHALTGWSLDRNHQAAACDACHKTRDQQGLETYLTVTASGVECLQCHVNVHNAKYANSECRYCHVSAPPRVSSIVMNAHGAQGTFPLLQGHRGLNCASCHTAKTGTGKINFSSLDASCGRCHADSLHAGTLGTQCTNCHVSGTWNALRFDHDATVPLADKSHREAACETCHPARAFDAAHTTCVVAGCHEGDDAHRGRLGTACGRCHRPDGDNVFRHDASHFVLDGKHRAVPCGDCHPSTTFKPRPTTCFGCHPEPRSHVGRFSTACESCHTTESFTIRGRRYPS